MTQLCTIAVQSSRGGDTGPAEPPLFCLPRVTEFGSFQAIKGARSCSAGKRRDRVWIGAVGPCVRRRFQSGSILNNLLSLPHPTLPASSSSSPWCLCCPGVPFGCSSGHERTVLSQLARLRNTSHVRKLGLGTRFGQHTFIALRILGRTVNKVTSRRSTST